ncbi:hypothetical protein Taro_011522 [Colocasia esculenta]|uniref:Alpha/beta-Hydrolases superfamily protein n=1 Tax=Colocasia esculenta TaxID=4460 RepID=A0A843UGE5_COLES|nr:hypothetical protein [Colocasia esculenta]
MGPKGGEGRDKITIAWLANCEQFQFLSPSPPTRAEKTQSSGGTREACSEALGSRSFLSVTSSLGRLMDDILVHLLTLTSHLSHRFIRFLYVSCEKNTAGIFPRHRMAGEKWIAACGGWDKQIHGASLWRLFSNHSPMYFVNTKKFFSKMGLACHIAKIHSEASVEQNAWELKKYIEELYWGSGKRVLILGHSKGGIDAAAALSVYWSDLKDKVAGLALAQSPYGGSPVASDILRDGQVADRETRRIMEFIVCKLIKGDIRALEDLTYERRKEFIANHILPSDEVPLVSFHTEASVSLSVVATMSHIAHAELPWLPACHSEANVGGRRVPVVAPVAAAMAVCAGHLQLRYGEKSDGVVTRRDAEVPGSVVVRLKRKLDHGWMVYATRQENHPEADACELCEALLTLLVEVGRSTKHSVPETSCTGKE